MPTFRHARDTYFAVQSSTGTTTTISDALREVQFPISLDTPETTAFGSEVKSYVVGIKEARFTCSGMYDKDYDDMLSGIYGYSTAREFIYGPEGSASGRKKYTGNVFLVNYSVSGSVGDMVGMQADFVVSGNITPGTFA